MNNVSAICIFCGLLIGLKLMQNMKCRITFHIKVIIGNIVARMWMICCAAKRRCTIQARAITVLSRGGNGVPTAYP